MAIFNAFHWIWITLSINETYFSAYVFPEAGKKRTFYILICFGLDVGLLPHHVPSTLGRFYIHPDIGQKHVINTKPVQALSYFSHILLISVNKLKIKCKWKIKCHFIKKGICALRFNRTFYFSYIKTYNFNKLQPLSLIPGRSKKIFICTQLFIQGSGFIKWTTNIGLTREIKMFFGVK